MAFKVTLEPQAVADIQQAIDYYNERQTGLGKRFHQKVNASFDALNLNLHIWLLINHQLHKFIISTNVHIISLQFLN